MALSAGQMSALTAVAKHLYLGQRVDRLDVSCAVVNPGKRLQAMFGLLGSYYFKTFNHALISRVTKCGANPSQVAVLASAL